MEELPKRKIRDIDGTIKEAEIYLYFKLDNSEKEYLIYTFGEIDNNGLIVIKTAELHKTNEKEYNLKAVETEEEWLKIKDIMRKIINHYKEV